jgi:hypothetical protein
MLPGKPDLVKVEWDHAAEKPDRADPASGVPPPVLTCPARSLGRDWYRKVRETRSSSSQQCPRGIPHSFVISSNLVMTNTQAVGFVLTQFKSKLHLPDGMGFSKLPVSSMLGLFVPTNTVSRRKQTWIVRLLRNSRPRNAISLRSPAQSGPLRHMSVFRVPPSDCCLSRGKAWPSRCSPGLKRSPSWPGNTRLAGSSSINRFTPPRRLSAKPSHPQAEPTRPGPSTLRPIRYRRFSQTWGCYPNWMPNSQNIPKTTSV